MCRDYLSLEFPFHYISHCHMWFDSVRLHAHNRQKIGISIICIPFLRTCFLNESHPNYHQWNLFTHATDLEIFECTKFDTDKYDDAAKNAFFFLLISNFDKNQNSTKFNAHKDIQFMVWMNRICNHKCVKIVLVGV